MKQGWLLATLAFVIIIGGIFQYLMIKDFFSCSYYDSNTNDRDVFFVGEDNKGEENSSPTIDDDGEKWRDFQGANHITNKVQKLILKGSKESEKRVVSAHVKTNTLRVEDVSYRKGSWKINVGNRGSNRTVHVTLKSSTIKHDDKERKFSRGRLVKSTEPFNIQLNTFKTKDNVSIDNREDEKKDDVNSTIHNVVVDKIDNATLIINTDINGVTITKSFSKTIATPSFDSGNKTLEPYVFKFTEISSKINSTSSTGIIHSTVFAQQNENEFGNSTKQTTDYGIPFNQKNKSSVRFRQTALQRKKLIFIADALYTDKIRHSIPKNYNFTDVDNSPCPINHCRITYNKRELNSSDAVYFDAREIMQIGIKQLTELRHQSDSQIWIWMMHENPMYTYYNVSDYNNLFNWSATYKPSSDVYIPYFGIDPTEGDNLKPDTNYAKSKDKKVLAIISHCQEYRIEFIRKLKMYISVDLYGACKDLINPELPPCERGTEACNNLRKRYKFYLAIENFYCEDYITEKYYSNSLMSGLVPIVLSGGNYSNENVFIKDSYINVEDFSDVANLGNYLNYLDKNDTAYNEYHQWKQSCRVGLSHGLCKVCKALWENDTSYQRKRLNLSTFWGINTCRSYKEKYFQKYLLD